MSGNTSAEQAQGMPATLPETKSARIPPEILGSVSKAMQDVGVHPEQARIVSTQVIEMMTKIHHGPLPPAEEFVAYNAGHPGAAKIILDMAVSSQKHHYLIESRRQVFDFCLNVLGQLCALGTVALMLFTAYQIVLAKEPWVAGVVLTCTGIAGGIAVWLKSSQRNEPVSNSPEKQTPPAQRKKSRR